jgi:four helix bundle protein
MSDEKENIILEKSFAFAIRAVKLGKYLRERKKEFHISSQVVRSGTSIGANAEEAAGGFTYNDFSAKMGIAYKEARETRFWLRLLFASGYIDKKMFDSLFKDCDELIRLSAAIVKTTSAKKKR